MKFTLSWLKKFLDTDCSAEEIGKHLTLLGLELEELVDNSAIYDPFIVAEIRSAEKHPNADSLKLCKVYDGSHELQIVCGAPNARAGIKVALAPVGSVIPNGNFKIKASKIRDVESNGMMCSENELGISDEHDGIIEMPQGAAVGSKVAPYYGLDDPIFEIAITPNRADCLGVYGIARDLAAKGVGNLKIPDIQDIAADFATELKLENELQKLCPLFTAFEVKNIQHKESPPWLKFLLQNVGCNSVSAIVDITNYICLSFGQPMHGYDAAVAGGKLHVAAGVQGQEFAALNDKTYQLSSEDIVIFDANGPSCIAGIMGAESSACDEETDHAYIECALFDRIATAKTGRRLAIDSDARYRFERGVDPLFSVKAAKLAMVMFQEIAGAKVSNLLVSGNEDYAVRNITIDPTIVQHKLGLETTAIQIKEILKPLGFECRGNDVLEVSVPSWRADVTIVEDLVEEIARIYGYDNLPVIPLQRESVGHLTMLQRRIRDSKRVLASRGYHEVLSWSFMDSRLAKFFTADSKLFDHLYLSNPISDVLDYMRPSIFGNLLPMVQRNLARSIHNFALFEAGPIFKGGLAQNIDDYAEIQVVAGVKIGVASDKNIHEQSRNIDVYDVKADIERLLLEFGIAVDKLRIDNNNLPGYYHPGRAAKLCLGKNVLAIFGELHPAILKQFDLEQQVMGFELLIESLPQSKAKRGARPNYIVSDYQAVQRDFAFVMKEDIAVGEVLGSLKALDRELIRDVSLFDVYQGQHIEDGFKSIAFSVKLQSDKDTLLDEQINNVAKKIEDVMQNKFAAVIRE